MLILTHHMLNENAICSINTREYLTLRIFTGYFTVGHSPPLSLLIVQIMIFTIMNTSTIVDFYNTSIHNAVNDERLAWLQFDYFGEFAYFA